MLVDSLPQHISDDVVFRTPPEGPTFGVRFSKLESAQVFLEKTRRYSYTTSAGDLVKLDATFRKTDARRARGLALHPAYLALESMGFDRDTIVPRHNEVNDVNTTRISLAEDDGSAWRLGVAQYTMVNDCTASIRGMVIEPAIAASRLDLVSKVLAAPSLST